MSVIDWESMLDIEVLLFYLTYTHVVVSSLALLSLPVSSRLILSTMLLFFRKELMIIRNLKSWTNPQRTKLIKWKLPCRSKSQCWLLKKEWAGGGWAWWWHCSREARGGACHTCSQIWSWRRDWRVTWWCGRTRRCWWQSWGCDRPPARPPHPSTGPTSHSRVWNGGGEQGGIF